jgi:hypothetical protein
MQRFIQQITQKLIDRLPDNDQYYRLYELRSWEFPSFIIQRIKIELERNLAESMIIPKTDWANTQSDAVLDAWQQFVDAIRAEARLPASYAKTVIETAVADIVEMLVQPRKNIPEVIFGNEDELNADAIRDRVQAVVVYPQFAKLIPRYMEKKELNVLTRQRCKKIVKSADEKLTKKYSPLNWAQMLEPLFKLSSEGIDTNLLRLFFEDRDMPRVARQLDLMDKSLTRAELIEVLSSPDLLNIEDDSEQSNLFADRSTSTKDHGVADLDNTVTTEKNTPSTGTSETSADDAQPQSEIGESEESSEKISESPFDLEEPEEQETSPEDEQEELSEKEHTINADFEEEASQSSPNEKKDTGEEDDSINALFLEEDEDQREEERPDLKTNNNIDEETGGDSEQDEQVVQDNIDETGDLATEEPKDEEQHSSNELSDQKFKNGQDTESKEEEETPMWMRYMSDEEIEEYKKKQEEGEVDEDGFIEEPIIDLTNEDASEKEIDKLRSELSGDREMFVEEIFGGSDRAYDEAVEDIAGYDSWRDVSKYIEKDVFKRNMVDMYSEPAVDFTDRLQSYFLQKQNRNK